jgi:uncharacterized RmlC-like cupin family protein
MKSSIEDLPVVYDIPQGLSQAEHWGGMTVSATKIRHSFDGAPLFKGLPDDQCQVPHWGYVIKGKYRIKFADHEEEYNAGDLYYIPPGHTPIVEEGLEYIEFSPTDKVSEQAEVVGQNMQAMQGG